MLNHKVGAPKDKYRVHWFLFNLSSYVKKNYCACYNYLCHKYFLFSDTLKRPYNMSFFSVVRTSRRCWRVVAVDCPSKLIEYKTFKTSMLACAYVDEMARKFNENQNQN